MLYHRVATSLLCFFAFSLSACLAIDSSRENLVSASDRENSNLRLSRSGQRIDDNDSEKPPITIETKESLVTTFVSQLTPFAVDISVSVSSPSTVECSLTRQEDGITERVERLTKEQQISKSALINFSGLKPKSSYTVSCTARPIDEAGKVVNSRPFVIITQEVLFEIRRIRRWRKSIEYKVMSNVKYPIACYLMDKQPNVIDMYESSTAASNNVLFTTPSSHTHYLTKCEMYDSKNNLLLSTSVEEIAPLISVWKVLGFTFLISMLSWIAYTLWRNRIVDDPSLSIIRRTDTDPSRQFLHSELTLPPRTRDTDILLDETSRHVLCKRCGFANNEKSVVCRECNALLKGNDFFQGKQQKVYF